MPWTSSGSRRRELGTGSFGSAHMGCTPRRSASESGQWTPDAAYLRVLRHEPEVRFDPSVGAQVHVAAALSANYCEQTDWTGQRVSKIGA